MRAVFVAVVGVVLIFVSLLICEFYFNPDTQQTPDSLLNDIGITVAIIIVVYLINRNSEWRCK